MTRIFDNIELELGDHLVATLAGYSRLDCAVGYFNLRGWSLFIPLLEDRLPGEEPVARVLIGMTTADPNEQVLDSLQRRLEGTADVDDIDREVARRRRERAILKFREQLSRGVPNDQDLQALTKLREQLADGRVAVKLFTRRALHGKTYIAHRDDINNPITAFVGSSNLTLAGLRHNYELNVDVMDSDGTQKLDQWFEDRWNDQFSLEITSDLVSLIDQSWVNEAPLAPYDVYLKVCYHLSRDVREGLVEFSIPGQLKDQLLDYQTSAVKTLARRIQNRGGTMLGDVVGLGKTITAIAVAATLREDYGYEPLIVCPKNLVAMWESYLDAYEIPGRVVPYSMAARRLSALRRYRFMIVDESHTLRSSTRQDYQALHDYIRRNDSKVLLLTATPYNIRFGDVANQIGLYVDDDADLGLQPMAALAKDDRLIDKVDGKVTSLAAFRRSDEPDDWRRLMSDHLVRRTRGFIKTNYAQKENGREYLTFADGTKFFFPTRTPLPIEHRFTETDPAVLMVSERTLDAISHLLLPRYGLSDYLSASARPTESEQDLVDRLRRASGHLSGFVRTGLYKRLSSCGYSYTTSLQRHLARNQMWTYAIDHGRDLPVGTILDAMFDSPDGDVSTAEIDEDLEVSDELTSDAQRDYEALLARSPAGITWVRPDLFMAELREDLVEDSRTIQGLLDEYGPWTHEVDSKIDALVELTEGKHADDKVLIFTEYADTARYVGEALIHRGIKGVGIVTGQTGNPTSFARRFSPVSNEMLSQAELDVGQELRVLVSTDVLSEGQNLQDAHVVVNYDLPWAIIRLIQRAGRVDRVGQKSDTVYVYSFFHGDVEQVLRLRERIRHRLEMNARVFGSDERFFGTNDETATIEGLYNGDLPDDEFDNESDNDASSVAYEVWTAAAAADPIRAERVKALPDLVYATRPALPGEVDAVGVYVRTERGMDGFGRATEDGSLELMTGQEALAFFGCTPETPGLERQATHFPGVEALITGPLRRSESVEGKLRGVRARVWKRMSGTLATAEPDIANALDAIYRKPLTVEGEERLKKALASMGDQELGQLLAVLHSDGRLVIPDGPGADPIRIVCSMGVACETTA